MGSVFLQTWLTALYLFTGLADYFDGEGIGKGWEQEKSSGKLGLLNPACRSLVRAVACFASAPRACVGLWHTPSFVYGGNDPNLKRGRLNQPPVLPHTLKRERSRSENSMRRPPPVKEEKQRGK